MTAAAALRSAAQTGEAIRVAVVIPAYKQPGLLPEALDSVLNQRAEFGIAAVVVDDGCPFADTRNAALTIARRHPDRVCYIRKTNGGLSSARNAGVAFALRAWPDISALYMLDADNRMQPDFLARAHALLMKSPANIGWIYPDFDMFGVPTNNSTRGPYSVLMHLVENYCEAGSLIRRAVFDAGIGFDETMQTGQEDWDFWLQAAAAGFRGRHLPQSGFQYRKRLESMLSSSYSTRDATIAGMRQKHKELMRPHALMRLAQDEMPDFAVYLGDKILHVADPAELTEGRALAPEEARRQFVDAMHEPTAAFFPPVLCFGNAATLAALNKYKLIRNVFWRALIQLRSYRLVAVQLRLGEPAQLGLQTEEVVAAHDIDDAPLLFVRTQAATAWLQSATDNDRKPFLTWVPREKMSLLRATLPAEAQHAPIEVQRPTPRERMLDELGRLRPLVAARTKSLPSDWRVDKRQRRNAEAALGTLLGCRTIYPHRKKDGVRDFGVTLPLSEFGGIERGKGNYAALLRARGWRPHLFITRAESAHLSPLAFEAYESVNFVSIADAEKHGPQQYFGVWTSAFAGNPGYNDALGLLGSMDLIINNHAFSTHALAANLRRFGVKMFVGVHMTERTPIGNPLGTPHSILGYEHGYDGIIVISDMLREWCIGQGVPSEKLHLIRNAPSYPSGKGALARSLKNKRNHNRPLRILFLGRLDRQKGLDRLSEIIRRTQGGPFAWRLVGKSVIEDFGTELASSGISIEPPVHTAEELDGLYGWADVMILTSRFEGVPLSILEAQRLGCVALTTDVGAVSEIVAHDVDGLVVPVNTDEETIIREFCGQLRRLAEDRTLARTIALRAARKGGRVRWDRNLKNWIERLEAEWDETPMRPAIALN